MKKLSALLLVLFGITSCQKSEVPPALVQLQNEVNESMEKLEGLDSASIANQFSKVQPYFDYLTQTEFDSALTEVYIKDLTWLDRYHRAIQKWANRQESHLNELQTSASQLSDLAHDAVYEKIDTSALNIYIQQERLAIEGVLRNIQDRGGEILYYNRNVDSMLTRLDSILPNLK